MVLVLGADRLINSNGKLFRNMAICLDLAPSVCASIELREKDFGQYNKFVFGTSPGRSPAPWAVGLLLLFKRCIETLLKASRSLVRDLWTLEIDDVDPIRWIQHRLPVFALAFSLLLAPP